MRTITSLEIERFCIIDTLKHAVITYSEKIVGKDVTYCNKNSLNEWSIQSLMAMTAPQI